MNLDVIVDSLPLYLEGLATTLELLVLALGIGLAAALPLAVARRPAALACLPVWCFTYVMRGTPLLVQLFLIYYGLAQFAAVRDSVLWPWLSNAWFCAVLSFGLNTCAYTVEIVAGAMRATPGGEIEAARSLGFLRGRSCAASCCRRRCGAPARLRQRGDHDAARHLAGEHRHAARPDRRRARGQLAHLPSVRGLVTRGGLLPRADLHPRRAVPARRGALAGHLQAR